jgi:hypothetical protein
MFGSRQLSPRGDLVYAGGAILLSGVMFILSLAAGLHDDHLRNAPQCAPEQVFTGARGQATLDGVVVHMTNTRVDLRVAGRDVSADLEGVERFDDRRAREAVRVTFYRGKVFHVKGQDIDLDAGGTPGALVPMLRIWSAGALFLGTMFGFAYLVAYLFNRPARSNA